MNKTTVSFGVLPCRSELPSADVRVLLLFKPSRLLGGLTLLAFLVNVNRAKYIPESGLIYPVSYNSHRLRTLLPPTRAVSGSSTLESDTIPIHASDATWNARPRNPEIPRTIWRGDTDWTQRNILYEPPGLAGYLRKLKARTNIPEEPHVDVAAKEQCSFYPKCEG